MEQATWQAKSSGAPILSLCHELQVDPSSGSHTSDPPEVLNESDLNEKNRCCCYTGQ